MNNKVQNLHVKYLIAYIQSNTNQKFHFTDFYPGGRIQGIVKIIADLSDIQLDLHPVPVNQIKKPQVVQACGVLGKLPALTFPYGVSISGLGPIILYFSKLSKNPIYGLNLEESSLIDQWINIAVNDLFKMMYTYLGPITGGAYVTRSEHDESVKQLRYWSKIISNHLELRTYLVGNSISVADICVACFFSIIFQIGVDRKFAKNYANLTRWLTHITSNPIYQKHLGVFRVQYTQMEFKSFKEQVALNAVENQKEKSKEGKTNKKVTRVQSKVEEKKINVFEDLESLPQTKLDFFNYKTLFVNSKDKKQAIKQLSNIWDENGFSIWKIHYIKAEGEGQILYKTKNLLDGFIQRFHDGFRKYALGKQGIFGDEPNLEIMGMWIIRGTKFPLVWKEHPSTQYFNSQQLDIKKDQDRNQIQDFMSAEEDQKLDGLTARTFYLYK